VTLILELINFVVALSTDFFADEKTATASDEKVSTADV